MQLIMITLAMCGDIARQVFKLGELSLFSSTTGQATYLQSTVCHFIRSLKFLSCHNTTEINTGLYLQISITIWPILIFVAVL